MKIIKIVEDVDAEIKITETTDPGVSQNESEDNKDEREDKTE